MGPPFPRARGRRRRSPCVSLITFGVLLERALRPEQPRRSRARAATDGRQRRPAVLERLALDMEHAAAQGRRRGFERARRQVARGERASCSRLRDREPGDRAQASGDRPRGLTEYAGAADRRAPATRSGTQLAGFAADQARASSSQLRRREARACATRATRIAAGGLAVLLVLIALLAYAACGRWSIPSTGCALRARARRGPLRHPPAGDRPAGDGRAGARVQRQRREPPARHRAPPGRARRRLPRLAARASRSWTSTCASCASTRRWREMNQVPAAEHLGRTSARSRASTRSSARCARCIEHAASPLLDVEIALHGRRFEASYFAGPRRPRRAARGRQGDDRRHRPPPRRGRARAPAGRDRGAGRAVTVADVAAVAVEQARAAFDADGAVLLLLDAERRARC